MTREELVQDLAYARALAEEGKQTPLVGGAYLVLFGVLLAICYGVQWAALSGLVSPALLTWVWLGFGVASFAGMALLKRRVGALPGAASIANRADRAVWMGVVAAIIVVVAGSIARGVTSGDFTAPNVIMASGFGLYGVALFATASLSNESWLKTFAFLAWAVSGVLWYVLNEPWAYLVAAGGALAVLLIPGFIMMSREPKSA